jgi:hypothetical protein
VKNAWSYTFTFPYVLATWCKIEHRHRDNFTFDKEKSVAHASNNTGDVYFTDLVKLRIK